jgi:hypothetical protein
MKLREVLDLVLFGAVAVCSIIIIDMILHPHNSGDLAAELQDQKQTVLSLADEVVRMDKELSVLKRHFKISIDQITRDRRPHINITSDSVDGVRVYNTMGEITVSQGHVKTPQGKK